VTRLTIVETGARQWTLGEPIGSGGFGQVYAATSNDRKEAVVKLVPKRGGASRELLFADNLRTVPNVLPVFETGETADSWALVTRLSPSWESAAGGHGERDGAVRAGGIDVAGW